MDLMHTHTARGASIAATDYHLPDTRKMRRGFKETRGFDCTIARGFIEIAQNSDNARIRIDDHTRLCLG